jgi:enamine deaminase RidA (YjgF/YER057c/UK114 family)
MTHKIHDIGVAKQIGRYSDAIETSPGLRWLYTSGTPGISKTGELPNDIEGQTRLAWEHILEALKHADMTIGDLVKVTTSLTNAKDHPRRRSTGFHASGGLAAHQARHDRRGRGDRCKSVMQTKLAEDSHTAPAIPPRKRAGSFRDVRCRTRSELPRPAAKYRDNR